MKSFTDVPVDQWATSCGICLSTDIQHVATVGSECRSCGATVVGYQDDGLAIWVGEGPAERLVRATAITSDGNAVRLATRTCHGREETIRHEVTNTFARRLGTEDFRITSIEVEGEE